MEATFLIYVVASLEVSGDVDGRDPQQPQPVRVPSLSSPLIPPPTLPGVPMIRPNGYSQWIEGESERERHSFIHTGNPLWGGYVIRRPHGGG